MRRWTFGHGMFLRPKTADGVSLPATSVPAWDPWARFAPAFVIGAVIALLAAGNGGYFAPSWGWSAAGLLWASVVALVLRRDVTVPRGGVVMLAAMALLSLWMLASQHWAGTAGPAVLESERALVYVAGAAALLVTARRGDLTPLLVGVLAAVTGACLYGLAGRLLPDWHLFGAVDSGRMAQPIGYWNGLGILAAMAALVALGLLAHARSLAVRMSAAATMPIVVTTLYFTYSRGAWISLGFGLVVAMAYDRRRWMLLAATAAVAPWLAGLVMVAARSHALTHVGSPLQQIRGQGHRLALVLLAVALVLLVVAALLHRLDGGWHPSATVARVGRICAAGVLILFVGAVLVFVGSPSTIAHRAYTGFNGRAPAANNPGVDLNKRLFSLSGNSRATLWRIAWNDVRANPVTGSGAGSYERVYLRHRTSGLKVTDAHSLYLEMLAEVGPFGLTLLLVALLTPLVVGVGTRSNPMVPAAIGGYAAFILHAGVDWDWELPAVTLTALSLGVAVLLAAERPGVRLSGRSRVGVLVVAVVLLVAALVGLRGNLAISDSTDAAARGDWGAALRSANVAATWAPWSAQSWVALGDARAGTHSRGVLSAYRHAVTLDPGDWETWFAVARGASGHQRVVALNRAQRLNPHGKSIETFRQILSTG
jgi:hypothetical protein